MPNLLPVKPFKQTPNYCGPACLKMVFAYYDVHASEKDIGQKARTTDRFGTSLAGLKKAAAHYGFELHVKDRATFKDIRRYLDRKIPVIVDWFSTDEGHYAIAVGLDDKSIYLQDPDEGGIVKLTRETFFRVWFDFRGDYLKKPSDLNLRRMIVVRPKR